MRLFLAVFPPADVQARAEAAIRALRAAPHGGGVSWVTRDNLHYTLRFLGELGADGARRAGEAAREAAAVHAPFDAALGALGAFPRPDRARVLWAGLSAGEAPFRALARSLEQALHTRGFERADKPFSPHLTLGRVRDRDSDWSEALAAAAPPTAAFRVDAIRLVKSTLSPKGSIYETLDRVVLAGERAAG
jgi:2'-5' RNA ligase